MELCKMNSMYLLGNINLSNVTSACLEHEHLAPYWIGILREKYLNTDQGNAYEKNILYSLIVNSKSRFCLRSVKLS